MKMKRGYGHKYLVILQFMKTNMTLKEKLIDYFRQGENYWIHSGNLERVEFKIDKGGVYKPSTVGRIARKLSEGEEPSLEKKFEGHSVLYWYRVKQEQLSI